MTTLRAEKPKAEDELRLRWIELINALGTALMIPGLDETKKKDLRDRFNIAKDVLSHLPKISNESYISRL